MSAPAKKTERDPWLVAVLGVLVYFVCAGCAGAPKTDRRDPPSEALREAAHWGLIEAIQGPERVRTYR